MVHAVLKYYCLPECFRFDSSLTKILSKLLLYLKCLKYFLGHKVVFYVLFIELPYNDYFEYFGPDFKLHISPSNMTNQNTPEYMEKIK